MIRWILIWEIALQAIVVRGLVKQMDPDNGNCMEITLSVTELKDPKTQAELESFLENHLKDRLSGSKIEIHTEVNLIPDQNTLNYDRITPSSISTVFKPATTMRISTFEATTLEDDSTSTALVTKTPRKSSTPKHTVVTTTTEGSCNITFNGTCYWTHVGKVLFMEFAQAEKICSDRESIPAYFPNEGVYNSVVEDLRSKIPAGWLYVYVWTGVTIDKNTRNVSHPSGNMYVKWKNGFPRWSGNSFGNRVALDVHANASRVYQGMFNKKSQWRNGIVCQTTTK